MQRVHFFYVTYKWAKMCESFVLPYVVQTRPRRVFLFSFCCLFSPKQYKKCQAEAALACLKTFFWSSQGWSSTEVLVVSCLMFPTVCLFHVYSDWSQPHPDKPVDRLLFSVCTAGGERARALSASYHVILDLLGSYLLVWRKTMAPWLAILLVYLISSTNIHQFCHRDHSNRHLFQGIKPTAYAHPCCVTASWLALVRTSEISINKITAKKAPPRV